MSSSEEELKPAFADGGGWTKGAADDEDEFETVTLPATLEFALSKNDDNSITGLLLNATAQDISLDLHPVLKFTFSPVRYVLDVPVFSCLTNRTNLITG